MHINFIKYVVAHKNTIDTNKTFIGIFLDEVDITKINN